MRVKFTKFLRQDPNVETENSTTKLSNEIKKNSEHNNLISFQVTGKQHCNIFDNYQWQGLKLEQLLLFEYYQLVTITKKKNKRTCNVDFEILHLNYNIKIQRVATSISHIKLVALIGSLSTNKSAEKAVEKVHLMTDA